MSAGIMIAWCDVPGLPLEEFGDEVRRRLKATKPEHQWELIDRVLTLGTMSFDWAEADVVYDQTAQLTEEQLNDVVEYTKHCLSELLSERSDVAILNVHGHQIFATGGMSHGEEPTDAYEYVLFLAATGFDTVGL